MKIRNKLSLLFTLITATIMLAFACAIYFSASTNREKEFYNTLKKEAVTKANVFLDAKVDEATLQTIYRKNREILNEVEVAVYDTAFNLLYHDALDIDFVKETIDLINEIKEKKEIQFIQQDWQVVGMEFYFYNTPYIITAAAYDEYGYTKLQNLRSALIASFLTSILIMLLVGKNFFHKALEPVSAMLNRVEEITATNLDLRVNEGNGKDEIAELGHHF